MRIPGLGLEIRRAPTLREKTGGLTTLSGPGGWFPIVREPFTGAWQRNVTATSEDAFSNPTAWSCITLIASDIAKIWLDLVTEDENGILTPTKNPAFSPVLRKPNSFSTMVKFIEYWQICKLTRGNTYVLKARDNRNVVNALYILDPARVQVLIAPDGSVFYQLGADTLARLEESVVIPAREMIHDLAVPFFHPLVGTPPLFASALAALQGQKTQQAMSLLFENGIQPGGILTTPHPITQESADRIIKRWEENYAGPGNIGRLAIVGDGMDFKPMARTAVESQLIEQLKWGDEKIAETYHVPGCLLGIAPWPPYTDIQSVNLQYYLQALQNPMANMERLLTEGLELPTPYSVRFDRSALLEMDSKTQTDVLTARLNGGLISINEGRAELDYPPVKGGESPMAQQQMFAIAALAERDRNQPFAKPAAPPAASSSDAAMKDLDPDEIRQKALALVAA